MRVSCALRGRRAREASAQGASSVDRRKACKNAYSEPARSTARGRRDPVESCPSGIFFFPS
ncbi:hypothetical protein DR62_06910 [Burkholderia thailandensis]|nr:hypothetical protein DR62_06910 [Burkholderia thailandensis]AOI51307.1 hypothetical protein WI24_05480 [Burkholderia thailandensis]AOJ50334.1 hypothetical protein AQ475_05420 [Burkholderia thailandensis]AOJ57443.1 hypothetical protein AQ477_13695 [Burkholderia thailandensis]AVR25741.1 hypothetical protein A8H32_12020 [Burkholderia thailandensis]